MFYNLNLHLKLRKDLLICACTASLQKLFKFLETCVTGHQAPVDSWMIAVR